MVTPQWYSFLCTPTVEYAGLPHSGTRLYALPTVEYARVPHRDIRFYTLTVEWNMQGYPTVILVYMHAHSGRRQTRETPWVHKNADLSDLSTEVWLSTNAKRQM